MRIGIEKKSQLISSLPPRTRCFPLGETVNEYQHMFYELLIMCPDYTIVLVFIKYYQFIKMLHAK